MKRVMQIAGVLLAATVTMGFDSADPWAGLEGEWAYQSTDNCGGANSIAFSYDYRRDREGNLVYLNQRPPTRRDRLATVMVDGDMDYLANIGDRMEFSGDAISLKVRRPALLPFRRFSDLVLTVQGNDTLSEQSANGDGAALMRAMGNSPVQLVRCPANED